MFFSKIPNVEYDLKPIQFPISNKEYVLAKNFFRRFILSDSAFANALYFNKYTIVDGERPDLIANKFYGTTELDWVILLTNNIINPSFDLPIRESSLPSFVESKYSDSDAAHHYETVELKNSLGEVILQEGLWVDYSYVSTTHKFYDRGTKTIIIKNGTSISSSVTNYQYEKNLNDSKREIYILRPEFIDKFLSEFEQKLEYKKSNAYIDNHTKKSGI
jgi:hypothetical protein